MILVWFILITPKKTPLHAACAGLHFYVIKLLLGMDKLKCYFCRTSSFRSQWGSHLYRQSRWRLTVKSNRLIIERQFCNSTDGSMESSKPGYVRRLSGNDSTNVEKVESSKGFNFTLISIFVSILLKFFGFSFKRS